MRKKKTVFKGTVNGVEYDNFEEYNKALNEAVEKGGCISATSNISNMEYDDEQEECEKISRNNINQLPQLPQLINLDELNSEDNQLILNACDETFTVSTIDNIIKEFKNLSDEDKLAFYKQVRNTMQKLSKDKNNNESTINFLSRIIKASYKCDDDLEDNINRLQQMIEDDKNNLLKSAVDRASNENKKNICDDAALILGKEYDYYNYLYNEMRKYTPTTEEPTNKFSNIVSGKETIPTYCNDGCFRGLSKLIDEIFKI